MPFIEHPDAEEWWSEHSIQKMNFEEDMNPYELDDDHPASKSQMTTRVTEDCVTLGEAVR